MGYIYMLTVHNKYTGRVDKDSQCCSTSPNKDDLMHNMTEINYHLKDEDVFMINVYDDSKTNISEVDNTSIFKESLFTEIYDSNGTFLKGTDDYWNKFRIELHSYDKDNDTTEFLFDFKYNSINEIVALGKKINELIMENDEDTNEHHCVLLRSGYPIPDLYFNKDGNLEDKEGNQVINMSDYHHSFDDEIEKLARKFNQQKNRQEEQNLEYDLDER